MARCMHACMHENIANVHMVDEPLMGAPIRFALCENVMQTKIGQTLFFFLFLSFHSCSLEQAIIRNSLLMKKRKKIRNMANLMRSKSPDQIVHGCSNGFVANFYNKLISKWKLKNRCHNFFFLSFSSFHSFCLVKLKHLPFSKNDYHRINCVHFYCHWRLSLNATQWYIPALTIVFHLK